MAGMFSYAKAAMERAMKVQEVILRAMTRKITWYQAAETIGISDRQMRRWGERYQEFGYDRLFDRRRGQPHLHSLAQVSVHRTDANLGHSAGVRFSGLCAPQHGGIRCWPDPNRGQ